MLSRHLSPRVTLITRTKITQQCYYISSNRPNDRDPNTLSVIDTCRRELFLSPPPQPGVGWDMAVAAVCQHASTQGIGMKSGRISLCPVEMVKNLTQNRS